MDARAGLLISHPHLHLLSHKLQSLLLFVGPEEKKRRREGKYFQVLLPAYKRLSDCMFEFGFLKHVLFGVSVSALCC